MQHKHGLVVTSLLALLLPAALAACSNDSSGASDKGSSGKRYSVGFVTAGVNLLGYKVMKCAAEDTADDLNLDLTWQGTPSTEASAEMTVLQSVIARKPDGIILVEQVAAAAAADGGASASEAARQVWGLVVQARGMECASCYVLDTCRVRSSAGFCTHFCLARVQCFGDPVELQLRNAWLNRLAGRR